MRDVDFSLSDAIVGYSAWPFLAVLTTCLPLLLLSTFASHFRRPDRGAWTGLGFHLAALLPAVIGMGWTLFGMREVARGVLKTGSGGVGSMAAGLAEALTFTALGFFVSAALVACEFYFIVRLQAPVSGESWPPGTWLLATAMAALLLVHGLTLVISMQFHAWLREPAGLHGLFFVDVAGVLALASVAFASIRHAARGREAPRRQHAVVAATLLAVLAAAGGITLVAVGYFDEVARTGML